MVKKAAYATPNCLLREARLERGWTQQQVADRIGAPLPPIFQPMHEFTIASVRVQLGEQAFAAAWVGYVWYRVPHLKWLFVISLLFILLSTLVFGGIFLLPVGLVLVITPAFYRWLCLQPGYARRLTKLPGLRTRSKTTPIGRLHLALVIAIYLAPALFISAYVNYYYFFTPAGFHNLTSYLVDYLVYYLVSIAGLIVVYGWLIRNWHLNFLEFVIVYKPLQRWLSRKRKTFEQAHERILRIYQGLPAAQAIQQAKETREMALKYFGDESPQYALSMNTLGLVYRYAGDYKTAGIELREAKNLLALAKGKSHPTYATCITNLADVYVMEGNYLEAVRLFQEGCAIIRWTLGWRHKNFALSLDELGQLYYKMGDYKSARPLFELVLSMYLEKFGKQHPQYARGLDNLALLAKAEGHYDEALKIFLLAQDVRLKSLGARHLEVAKSLSNVASMYSLMGNYNVAVSLYERALDIQEDFWGKNYPEYAANLNELAVQYNLKGDFYRAESLIMKKKWRELRFLSRTISLRKVDGPGSEGRGVYERELKESNDKKQAKEAELAQLLNQANFISALSTVNHEAIARALLPGSALVEFIQFNRYDFRTGRQESHYLAFIVKAGKAGDMVMIDLGEARQVNSSITAFRNDIKKTRTALRPGSQQELSCGH